MAKKKKKPAPKQKQARKIFTFKRILAIIIVLVIAASAVTVIVFASNQSSAKQELRGTKWASETAKNASGDEVDIREVYNVRYSNYQGRLTFEGADGFELWMSPGDKGDGTHSGTYELKGDKAEVVFDDGTKSEFGLIRDGGEINQIIVPYENYEIGFFRENTQ